MTPASFPKISFDWLVAPATPQQVLQVGEIPNGQKIDYPIPQHFGHGSYETWTLTPGMSLFFGRAEFTEAAFGETIPLAEINAHFPEPTLGVQSVIRGSGTQKESDFQRNISQKSGVELFRYCTSVRFTPAWDCSADITMIALMVGRSVLDTLLGDAESAQLLNGLALLPAPKLVIRQIPHYVTAPLHNCLASGIQPALKGVLAQARALEYLVNLSQYLAETGKRPSPSNDRKTVHKLHDYLLRAEGNIPTLMELAKLFGRSAKALNQDFEAEYKISIYTFLQEHRMNSAHEAIRKTDIPLKQLSERLGYTHVNNFSAAFKRRFGYAPGSLRKR